MATTAASIHQVAPSELTVQWVRTHREFLALESVWDRPSMPPAWRTPSWNSPGHGPGGMLRRRERTQHCRRMEDGRRCDCAPDPYSGSHDGYPAPAPGFFYNSHVPRADFIVAAGRDDAYRAIWEALSARTDWDLLQLCSW